MALRSVFVGLVLCACAGLASADQPQPIDFSDPNIRMPYSGGSHPIAWAPKYTTDSYAWTEADRSLLQRVALQRTLAYRAQRQMQMQAMLPKNTTQETNRGRAIFRIMRSMQKQPVRYLRAAKPIRIEPLPFVGAHAGPGIAKRLPVTRVEGGAPTFARLRGSDDRYSFAKDGGGSFSFGSAGGSSFSFGSSLSNGESRPFHFNVSQ